MIAFAGALRLEAGQHGDAAIRVMPRWDMASLPPLATSRESGVENRESGIVKPKARAR
jgi:N6-L-threonylcarbamoyladenine synthase